MSAKLRSDRHAIWRGEIYEEIYFDLMVLPVYEVPMVLPSTSSLHPVHESLSNVPIPKSSVRIERCKRSVLGGGPACQSAQRPPNLHEA